MIPSMLDPPGPPTTYGYPQPPAATTSNIGQPGSGYGDTTRVRVGFLLYDKMALTLISAGHPRGDLYRHRRLRTHPLRVVPVRPTYSPTYIIHFHADTACRLMCLRRVNRPLKDFLKPLPPPSEPRRDREASPQPSRLTTHSEQMCQTIFLPTLPIAAPQHLPVVYTVPGVSVLPLYDAKDAPPGYEEAVLHGPSATDASSSSRPPGVGRQELRRSASQ